MMSEEHHAPRIGANSLQLASAPIHPDSCKICDATCHRLCQKFVLFRAARDNKGRHNKDAFVSHFSFLISLSLSLSLSRFLSLSFSFLPAHFCNNSQIESQVSWTDLPSSCTGLSVHRHLAEIFAICLGTTESIKKPSADHSTHYPLNKQISTKLQHSLEISLSSLDWLNGRAPKCNQPSHRKNTP